MMSNFANPFLAQAKDNNGNLKMLEDTIRTVSYTHLTLPTKLEV